MTELIVALIIGIWLVMIFNVIRIYLIRKSMER